MELTVQREDTLNSCDHVTDNSQHLLNAISVMIIFGCGLRRLKDWLKRHESTFSPPTAVWGLAVQGWLWQPFYTKFSDPDSFYLWHCTVTPTHSPDGCSGSATSAPEGIVLEAFPTWWTSSGTGVACRVLYGIWLLLWRHKNPCAPSHLSPALASSSASLVAEMVKDPPEMQETQVQSLDWEDSWWKERQSTPLFLPGESHGRA